MAGRGFKEFITVFLMFVSARPDERDYKLSQYMLPEGVNQNQYELHWYLCTFIHPQLLIHDTCIMPQASERKAAPGDLFAQII
jgi:hypothetical protein